MASLVRLRQIPPNASLAQLEEQRILNPKVAGSNPSRRTIILLFRSIGRTAASYAVNAGSSPAGATNRGEGRALVPVFFLSGDIALELFVLQVLNDVVLSEGIACGAR